jgi:glyoxylase-like metal-dependent hydrolase (beta-lactamase superfamily II)
MAVRYGEVVEISPLVRRVLARNPSPFTFHGTATYIVGQGEVAVIDPGPDLPEHLEALVRSLKGETVKAILVTHTHRDHSPAAAALARLTRAPTYGFGPHGTRRAMPPVEEGADYGFVPDHRLTEGAEVSGPGWALRALHTPGHTSNHLCFALPQEKALFPGDHVMGWSTTVISPPDGDMRAYLDALGRLLERDDAVFYPTHGPPIRDPKPFVRALIAHRREREQAILACLERGKARIPDIVSAIYSETPASMHEAAARSVLAHLVHLVELGRVHCEGPLEVDGRFALASSRPG